MIARLRGRARRAPPHVHASWREQHAAGTCVRMLQLQEVVWTVTVARTYTHARRANASTRAAAVERSRSAADACGAADEGTLENGTGTTYAMNQQVLHALRRRLRRGPCGSSSYKRPKVRSACARPQALTLYRDVHVARTRSAAAIESLQESGRRPAMSASCCSCSLKAAAAQWPIASMSPSGGQCQWR